jgi:outer membrane protein OmpA-like peptidoglycan-associated protein
LSLARAQAVMTAITGKGVAAARLSAAGLGQTKPIDDNATEAGRAKNRRVELVRK